MPLEAATVSTPPRRSFLRSAGEFLRLVLIAAAIALPIRYFIAQPFIVRGESMEPSFREKEYLVIDELSYYFREPERGEVVVFHYPLDPKEYFIKRVIGLPGETVEFRNNAVFVINSQHPDGFKLDEPYLAANLETRSSSRFTLGANEYVVLGDNRLYSSDSRSWGVLDRKFMTGRALLRVLPPNKLGIIRTP